MINYTLVVGSSSFLGKSFIRHYSGRINILGISVSKKKIEDYRKNISLNFSYKNLNEITKDKKINSLIYFHSYGTSIKQKSIKKIYFSNFELAKKFYEFAKMINTKYIYFGSVSEFDKDIDNHYALAKKKMTNFLRKSSKRGKIHVIILKLFYIYGLGENKNRLLSKIKQAIHYNKIFYLYNPNQKIDFLHISDFLNALFKVIKIKSKKNFLIYKLCYGKKFELKKVFKNFENIKLKKSFHFVKNINYNISGHKKFKKDYKWNPKIKLLEGIDDFFKTV